MIYTLLEYLDPVSPSNRRPFDPIGDGPTLFEATPEDAIRLQLRLGADSPFRVVPLSYAQKFGLLP